MQPNLMDVYRSMLATTAMNVTADGFVRMEIDPGEHLPVTAKDGKPVVLPMVERLRALDVDKTEVFHLLSENSGVHNNSDLLTRYRHWLINRYNIVLGSLGAALLRIAADQTMSKNLRPDQKEFLGLVVEADERTIDDFNKFADLAAKPNQLVRVFMTMYIRNAAVIDSKSYGRATAVSFPFFEEIKKLDDEIVAQKKEPKGAKKQKIEHEVFGVPIRIKDRAVIMGLMHYLIPNLGVPHAYDVGSNSRIAPSIDSMMRAFLPMARHLNDVMDIFRGVTPDMDRAFDEMYFDLDWQTAFNDLDALWPQIRMTPNQNAGVIDEPTQTAPTGAATPAPQATTPPWGAPQPAPQNAFYQPPPPQPAPAARPGTSGGAVNVNEMMAMTRGNRMLPPPPHMGGYGGYPQQQTQYPGVQYPGQQYPGQGYPTQQQGYPQPGPQGYPAPGPTRRY